MPWKGNNMNLDEYEFHYGRKVDDLMSYNSFLVSSVRQTGRTTAMIKSLPTNKNVIIVAHSTTFANLLRDEIKRSRPDIDQRKLTIVVHSEPNLNGIIGHRQLMGKRGELFIDNSVIDRYLSWYLDRLTDLFAPKRVKLTLDEIEERLGYPVEIIKK